MLRNGGEMSRDIGNFTYYTLITRVGVWDNFWYDTDMKIVPVIILCIAIIFLLVLWFVRPREISVSSIIFEDIRIVDGQITSSGKTIIGINGLVASSALSVVKIVEQEDEDSIHIKILGAPTGLFGAKSGSFDHGIIMNLGLSKRVTIGKEKVEIYPNNNVLLE